MSEASLLRALVLEDEWPTRNYLVKLIEGTRRAEVIGAIFAQMEAPLPACAEAIRGPASARRDARPLARSMSSVSPSN